MPRIHYVAIAECAGVHDTAVVIDVLRAFSTAAWAFELGADSIVLSDDVDEALEIKASIPGALALKDSRPYDGFELTNSPIELKAFGDIRGRAIVQKTTAGTVGAVAARHAERLYCASFLVAAATAGAIRSSDARDIYFVVTGEGGAGDEDRACAEYIAALIDDPSADAELFLERVDASNAARLMRQRVMDGVPGVDAGDILACMDANRFGFVMRAQDEGKLLVLRAYNQNDG
ncbi:MAG TPA: 2-phosphosulfolactate phosphatase [Dehalococcoidia bacterium]|nr:2-phosphosulfolactate phosphatase [Dehalococcoidia bacterium]